MELYIGKTILFCYYNETIHIIFMTMCIPQTAYEICYLNLKICNFIVLITKMSFFNKNICFKCLGILRCYIVTSVKNCPSVGGE